MSWTSQKTKQADDDDEERCHHGAGPPLCASAHLATRRFASEPRNHLIRLAPHVTRQVAQVDHVAWPEGPDWQHRQEADPAHEIDGVGLWMLASDGDAPWQSEQEDHHAERDDAGKDRAAKVT